ncbi:MAG: ATP-binding cassette domain-containing protein [Ruminococcus sp.]|nr:ATP-binding cassette domain-containing protein [Ruminococcus sp.]
MLQIKNISKHYTVGGIVTKALDDVSLNLRDNEFVAILGPSGSGKTTLLNIVGGLDRYDSGDLIINGISTKKYSDRDWDSYRNHTIGFVFQSYNLIPHQTILSNVELALTISGISKKERKNRAKEALLKVGLERHLNKKPNQLSGGQMQRVAIARALVNNPDILLADEPTGALDSDTSVQVMELLKEVAKDRLVVMVTHNPELAEEYATRIVRVKDGVIHDDSNPFIVNEKDTKTPEHKNMGKASMSFKTALSLSFNNLLTKKARTLLTSFAGSIGIIGIALILALSNGVNLYINSLEEDTLSEYPIQISKSEMDMTSMMANNAQILNTQKPQSGEVSEFKSLKSFLAKTNTNDLKSLKKYIEENESVIKNHSNAVEYKYNVTPNIFRLTSNNDFRQINPDKTLSSASASLPQMTAMMLSMGSSHFNAMPEKEDLYINQYDVKTGRWPQNYNECVVVLNPDGSISDLTLYAIGLKDITELDKLLETYAKEGFVEIEKEASTYKYDDFLELEFKLVDPSNLYKYDKEHKVYVNKSDDKEFMIEQIKNGETLKVVGVVQPSENANAAMLMPGIAYPSSLTSHVIEVAQNSEIVKAQKENPETNIFTGKKFTDKNTSLNMDSLFKFDKNALDMTALANGLDMSSMLSGMDMSSMMENLDLSSAMENMDLSSVMGDMDMSEAFENVDMSELFSDVDMSELLEGVDFEEALSSIDIAGIIGSMDFSNIEIPISSEDVKLLFDELLNSYVESLGANASPTFNGFYAYVQSEAGQQIIKERIGDIADLESAYKQMQEQITDVVYGSVCDAFGEAMAPVVEQISVNLTEMLANKLSPVFSQMTEQFIGAIANGIGEQISVAIQQSMGSMMAQMGSQISNGLSSQMQSLMGSIQKALTDAFSTSMDSENLEELMSSMMNPSASTLEEALSTLNYAEFDDPYMLLIYPKDFESKETIVLALDDYNSKMEKSAQSEKVITYTDMVGTLMSSVTTIINTVSYVLIAFVAVSLIVSSIMIGIITYISVLERTKEIGILRAVGASKRNISQVFNAETFIIGLCSGVLGIATTLLLLIPGNALIHHLMDSTDINAVLPIDNALWLIVLSVILTLIGGLIPSKKAAKKDPVTALRSE